jgi:putative oxidoreductase
MLQSSTALEAASPKPLKFTPELRSLARIIFGFLVFRHGMEQVLGFPGSWLEVPTASPFGVLKLLCFPGGLLIMVGLFTRSVALVLGLAHLLYWLVEPLPEYLLEGSRLFGSRGAPTDHLMLPALFFIYVSLTGPGPLSLDRLLGRGADTVHNPRRANYALTVLRLVAGFLFIFHGTGKIAPTLDPMSLRALAMVLEILGGPMIMLGLWTRPLAFLLSGEMAFAYFMSHAPEGFWGSFREPNQEAAILFCFFYLFLWAAGPGPFSLDSLRSTRARLGPMAIASTT